MLYRSLAIMLVLAGPALALAASPDNASSDKDTANKVDCIIEFVNSELDKDKHDSYIQECLQKKMSDQQAGAQKKG
jgi:hypothetical protein